MSSLFLSPHNDDETLFGAFTLLRERPLVVVVFESVKQERVGISSGQRERETDAAMKILGCEWKQMNFLDTEAGVPLFEELVRWLAGFKADHDIERVYAPAIEEDGHVQHNYVGQAADIVYGRRVTHYMTYANGRGRSEGPHPVVVVDPAWVGLKLRALACYESQIREPSTGHHFCQALHEWYE